MSPSRTLRKRGRRDEPTSNTKTTLSAVSHTTIIPLSLLIFIFIFIRGVLADHSERTVVILTVFIGPFSVLIFDLFGWALSALNDGGNVWVNIRVHIIRVLIDTQRNVVVRGFGADFSLRGFGDRGEDIEVQRSGLGAHCPICPIDKTTWVVVAKVSVLWGRASPILFLVFFLNIRCSPFQSIHRL